MFDDNDQIETDLLNPPNNWFVCENNCVYGNYLPTKNAREFVFKVDYIVPKGYYVSVRVIINQ